MQFLHSALRRWPTATSGPSSLASEDRWNSLNCSIVVQLASKTVDAMLGLNNTSALRPTQVPAAPTGRRHLCQRIDEGKNFLWFFQKKPPNVLKRVKNEFCWKKIVQEKFYTCKNFRSTFSKIAVFSTQFWSFSAGKRLLDLDLRCSRLLVCCAIDWTPF